MTRSALAPGDAQPEPAGEDHPLSYPQEQLWFIERLQPGRGNYNELWLICLDGSLSRERLTDALNAVVRRHPSLRATFHETDRGPRARILPSVSLSLADPVDLSHLPVTDRDRVVEQLAGQFADRPYDLARGPLLRVALVQLDEQRHALLIGLHHLIADGWSAEIVLDELDQLYRDPFATLQPVLTSYSAFARAQRDRSESAAELEFWRQQLADCPPVLDLAGARLRPPVRSGRGERVRFDLDAQLVAGIDDLAMAQGCTRAGVLLAALAVVLHRHTGRRDPVIGSATEARHSEELEAVVGFFATLLPLRLNVDPWLTFRGAIERTTELSLDVLDHQDIAFSRLVEIAGAGRDASCPPLVQVVFSHTSTNRPSRIGPLAANRLQVRRDRARFDLLMDADTSRNGGSLWIEYDTERFSAKRISLLVAHLRTVLAAGLADPDLPLADLPMLTPTERGRALGELLPTGAGNPQRDVVFVDGAVLAPTAVVGQVYTIRSPTCGLVGDRVVTDGPPHEPTGQLGYWDEDGVLVYLGPAERFPEIDGSRVPLDRVEATLAVHPSVRSARVWVEDGRLVADVVPVDDGVDRLSLVAHTRARLPRYAVPTIVGADPVVVPDATRDALLKVWQTVLRRPDLSPTDDFFEAGGYSLLAADLVDAIRAEFGVQLPLRQIFTSPTVSELAVVIAGERRPAADVSMTGVAWTPVPEPVDGTADQTGGAPLTAAQADIWVVQRLVPDRPVYNVPIAIDIAGPLDCASLATALEVVVARHDVLRCRFVFASPRVEQRPGSPPARLKVIDLSALPASTAQREADIAERDEARRPFDLSADPPLRVTLLRLPGQRFRMLFCAHHIAVDGIGVGVVMRELSRAYAALRVGADPELPDPEMSWQRYARWEGEWLSRHESRLTAYWQQRLDGLGDLPLPTDRSRPQRLTFEGGHLERTVPVALGDAVRHLAERLRSTPFAVSTAAVAALLHRRTGADTVPVATPAANRHTPATRALVGCCISMLVLPVRYPADGSFAALVEQVRDLALDAFEHQGLPLPAMIRASGARREANRAALFQVASDWQEDLPLRLTGCTVDWRFTSTGTARNDLSFTATSRGRELRLSAEYNTNLWESTTVVDMLAEIESILHLGVTDPARRV